MQIEKLNGCDAAKNIFIAGHRGMIGSAIMRQLSALGCHNIITRTHSELDFINQQAVVEFFQAEEIDVVYMAAAKVGGIIANSTYPADFIYENLMMECNIIHSAHLANVNELLFLGSSCIYPALSEQPMEESQLLSGVLEPTNEPYAVAKIAGLKLCESYNRQYGRHYRSAMPSNLYGPGDNFHAENSHVVPALLVRIHDAKLQDLSEVIVWGSGKPMREFLYVDDAAAACIHIMDLTNETYDQYTQPMQSHINVGTGLDCTILELAETVSKVVGYEGAITFDTSKPDGMYRKVLDVSILRKLGWQAERSLEDGLIATYSWFLENQEMYRR